VTKHQAIALVALLAAACGARGVHPVTPSKPHRTLAALGTVYNARVVHFDPQNSATTANPGSLAVQNVQGVLEQVNDQGVVSPIGGGPGGTYVATHYGAVGNGIADDSTALAAVIALACANHGGVFLDGTKTFRVAHALTVACDGLAIDAGGPSSTWIAVDDSGGAVGDAITFNHTTDCTIRNLTITSTTARTAGWSVVFNGGHVVQTGNNATETNGHVEHVVFDNQFSSVNVTDTDPGVPNPGNPGGGAWDVFISDSIIRRPAANGIGIQLDSPHGGGHHIRDVFYWGKNDGGAKGLVALRIRNSGDFSVIHFSEIQAQRGLVIDPQALGLATAGFFSHSEFDTNDHEGVLIQPQTGGSAGTAQGIDFTDVWSAHNEYNYRIFGPATNITITGGKSWWATLINIQVDGATWVTLNGVNIGGAAFYDGVQITGHASHIKVANCLLGPALGTPSPNHGIEITDGGVTNYSISGNDITTADGGAAIIDNGGAGGAVQKYVQSTTHGAP
jgi:hypothetical protein